MAAGGGGMRVCGDNPNVGLAANGKHRIHCIMESQRQLTQRVLNRVHGWLRYGFSAVVRGLGRINYAAHIIIRYRYAGCKNVSGVFLGNDIVVGTKSLFLFCINNFKI